MVMTNSLQSILNNRMPSEPPEIKAIKQFARDRLKTDVTVTLGKTQIAIGVPSAAAAGALRMQLFELAKLLETDKRLVIRIGQ